jgi:hypothetical protein
MANTNVYVKGVGALFVAIALYGHDYIIVTNDHKELLPQTKVLLCVEFDMSDMGEIKYYIGLQVKRNHELCIVEFNQFKYRSDVLKIFGMENCKSISTPLELGSKLIKHQSLNLEFSQKKKMVEILYKSIVGSLIYAIVYT